ncbi:TolC family protein [Lutimonas sp.]|uniref:TolC family protein n=1 Tax=Lutimonas sp. TaxID=1872403 RepID=UPI003D9BB763
MKQLFFNHILFVFCLFTLSSGYGQLSLDSCQAKARRNYPMIKQFGLIDQTKAYTTSNANKAFLPQLSFNIIGGVVDGFPSFDAPGSTDNSSSSMQLISVVQLNQAIWDGGITKANKEIIKANSEKETAEVEVALYQIRERVDNLFFGILLIDAQIDQQEIYLDILQKNTKRIEIAVENGTAYKSDLDEVKVELLNAEERILELNYNKKAYKEVLAAMMGEPLSETTSLQKPSMKVNDLQQSINRPELSMFASQRAMIDAQAGLNRSTLYPKIGLLGFGTFLNPGINFGASDIDRILVAGLSLSWDVSGLYRNGNNKKLEEVNLLKVDNQEEAFLFNTNLQIDQTQIELQKYQDLIEKSEEVLAIKSRIKKAYEVKYENGVSTMTELLDKTNEENLANQKLIFQEIQYLQKVYEYKYKSGN